MDEGHAEESGEELQGVEECRASVSILGFRVEGLGFRVIPSMVRILEYKFG